MRWKIVCLVLLAALFLQCGEDATTPGNAQPVGKPATVEVFEFYTPEELRNFRFPKDTKGTLGFKVTRIEKELQPIRATPVFVADGQHGLEESFINTEVVRILVFR
jgi:hypothetical protein